MIEKLGASKNKIGARIFAYKIILLYYVLPCSIE